MLWVCHCYSLESIRTLFHMCTKSTEHASGTLFTCCVVYTTGRSLYVAIYRTYFNIIFYYVSKHILPCPRTKRLALNCFSIIYIATCMSILVFASKTFILRCPNIWHSSSLFCIIFKRFFLGNVTTLFTYIKLCIQQKSPFLGSIPNFPLSSPFIK